MVTDKNRAPFVERSLRERSTIRPRTYRIAATVDHIRGTRILSRARLHAEIECKREFKRSIIESRGVLSRREPAEKRTNRKRFHGWPCLASINRLSLDFLWQLWLAFREFFFSAAKNGDSSSGWESRVHLRRARTVAGIFVNSTLTPYDKIFYQIIPTNRFVIVSMEYFRSLTNSWRKKNRNMKQYYRRILNTTSFRIVRRIFVVDNSIFLFV